MKSLFNSIVIVLLAALSGLVVPASAARGQCPSDWLPGHGIPGVRGHSAIAVAVLPDGDVMVGGIFEAAGDVQANSIARFSPKTSKWTSPRVENPLWILALAVLPNGDVVVGGNFGAIDDLPAKNIVLYRPSTGEWSTLGSGTNSSVGALAILPDGDVIAGGYFTTAGGVSANGIARYNPRTRVWSALGSGVTGRAYAGVHAAAVLPDGDVIVGGAFTTAGGVEANCVARYSPRTGVWSALGSGTDWPVNAIAVMPDGDVLVGGGFNSIGGVAANGVARYNPRTGVWSALGTGLSGNCGFTASSIVVLPDGDVLVGGSFTAAGGVEARGIARYRPSSGVWSALPGPASRYFVAYVSAMVVLANGDVIACGEFDSVGGVAALKVARLRPSTGAWSALNNGTDRPVGILKALPSGNVLAGGAFTTIGGIIAKGVAEYNPRTGVWSALGSGIGGLPISIPWTFAVLPDGDVIVGGTFATAGGVAAAGIARYSPRTGAWSALGSGVNGEVGEVAVLPNGDVLVGGSFTTAGGVEANNIARYRPSTGVWSAVGGGTEGFVGQLAVLPDGDILASGYFSMLSGPPATWIARYSSRTDEWSTVGDGTVAWCYGIAALPDGDVLVSGVFRFNGSEPVSGLARYRPSTGAWLDVVSGPTDMYELEVLANGDVIVGGRLWSPAGLPAPNIARYRPSTGAWSTLGAGVNGPVYAVAELPNGDLLVGGDFTQAGDKGSAYVARYSFGGEPDSTIVTQPTPQVLCRGGSAAISVEAAGAGPFSYQWRFQYEPGPWWFDLEDGWSNKGFRVSGARSRSITITNTSGPSAGSVLAIRAIVTDACGSVTSDVTTITDCAADFDCSGTVDVADIFAYLSAWFAREDRAQFDTESGFQQSDIQEFLSAWFAGGC